MPFASLRAEPEARGYMRVSATELRSGNFPTHVHLPGERARKELHPDHRGSKPRVLSVTPRAQRPWTESNRLPILREDLSCPVDDRGHGRGRSRTRITLVRSEALYPLSYASRGRRPDLPWHRPRVRPSGIHGGGTGPTCTGICGSGDRPVAGYRHRPLGPRARVERASRGPQPRLLAVGRSRSLGCGAGSCTPFSSA